MFLKIINEQAIPINKESLEHTTLTNQKAASAIMRMPLLYYIIR